MLDSRPAHTRDYEFASLSQHFHRDANVMGCTVDRGRFRVYSDWRTHGDGFGRMLVHGMPDDDAPNQRTAAGKALQRLLELDKYRALALLALPFAQKLTPRIEVRVRVRAKPKPKPDPSPSPNPNPDPSPNPNPNPNPNPDLDAGGRGGGVEGYGGAAEVAYL